MGEKKMLSYVVLGAWALLSLMPTLALGKAFAGC